MAPAGTPPEIVEQVNAAVNRLLEEPETHNRIVDSGADVLGDTPTAMGEFYASERERFGRVARDANIRLEWGWLARSRLPFTVRSRAALRQIRLPASSQVSGSRGMAWAAASRPWRSRGGHTRLPVSGPCLP
jgi:hypothetical protein